MDLDPRDLESRDDHRFNLREADEDLDRKDEAAGSLGRGVKRERELAHDVQVYRAYERAAARLEGRGAHVDGCRLPQQNQAATGVADTCPARR